MRHTTPLSLLESDSGYALAHGNNIGLMDALPEGCVDLVFGSPPYEEARTYGIGYRKKGQDWVDEMVETFRAAVRITRGLVIMVVGHGKTRHYQWSATPALLMADLHRAGFVLRAPIIYERVGIAGSGGPDYFRYDYEFCVVAQNPKYALGKQPKTEGRARKGYGRLPWANPLAAGEPPRWGAGGAMSHRLTDGSRRSQWGGSGSGGGSRRNAGDNPGAGDERQQKTRPSHEMIQARTFRQQEGKEDQVYIPPVLANPGIVVQENYTSEQVEAMLAEWEAGIMWHCQVGGGQMGHKLAHENEAPFPTSLAERGVLSFVPPGGVVLDPYLGSGTTLQVALENRRRAIGFDLRDSQLELTQRRLDSISPRLIVEADEKYKRYVEGKKKRERPRKEEKEAARKEAADHRAEGQEAGLFDRVDDPVG